MNAPVTTLARIAAVASIALTAIAFWLSYAHLHAVAAAHGLATDDVRAWAWPATVDLFIVIGEVLILRSSLQGRVDPWAICLTVVGSAGSIYLNVAGVGPAAQGMDYVVAAVPPVAALLAFGALMRQIHGALAARLESAPKALPEQSTKAPQGVMEDAVPPAPKAPPVDLTKRPTADDESAPEDAPKAPQKRDPKAPRKRPEGVTRNDAKAALRALYDKHGRRPLEGELRAELERIKYRYTSRQHANTLRAEIEQKEPKLAELGSDNVHALTGS